MANLDLFRHDFVVSIKPEYADRIMDGTKKVELRRRFPYGTVTGARMYVYASAPTQALLGYVTIDRVDHLDVGEIWRKYNDVACISSMDFEEYYRGRRRGYAIRIENPVNLVDPIPLPSLKSALGFTPPQSFAYADDLFKNFVGGH